MKSENLGAFYKYLNRRISYRPQIGALTDDSGNVKTDDHDRAELFNSYFATVGVVDNGKIPVGQSVCSFCASSIETVEIFDEHSIVSATGKLKPNLSSRPDRLPPLLFKQVKFSIAKALAVLFPQLLSVGFVPQKWKTAIITPLFKKGTTGSVGN